MKELHSLSVERNSLAAIFRHPKKYPDIDGYIKDVCYFHPVHRTIFNALKDSVLKGETPNHVVISAKIKGIGIQFFEEDLDIERYIETIYNIRTADDAFESLFKELFALKVKRDLFSLGQDIQNAVVNGNGNLDDIVKVVDDIYAVGVTNSIKPSGGPIDILDGFDTFLNDRVDNPPDPNEFMFGPFESINTLLGSLHKPGNITCFGARSGVGKTSWSLFYNLAIAMKYNVPILWYDFGEMSDNELRMRAAACISGGVVSIHDVEYGLWAKNPTKRNAIKAGLEKIKNVKLYYEDISRKKPIEILNSARRFKYNKVGRENQFVWVLDYLKPFDDLDGNTPEWKMMGHFIQDCKSFIKNELNTSLFTSVQLNRNGITNGRNSAQLDDSENSFGLSDRIIQQCSHGILLRNKVRNELEAEQSRYGNGVIKWLKTRHLGINAERALTPVEVVPGKYQSNHINFSIRNFYFEEIGDLVDQIQDMNNMVQLDDTPVGDLPL